MRDSRETVNPYAVRSLERGLHILNCLEPDRLSLTLTELCERTGLHKATCFRLVKTLEAEDYLAFDAATGKYRLGSALVRVALLAMSHEALARLAHPHLASLTDVTGDTADLTTWSHAGPLLIDQSLTRRVFHPRNAVGQVFVDAQSTHARIWLVFGNPVQRRRALELYAGREGISPDEMEAFERDLETVRRNAYALDVDEDREACAVGVPVWGAPGDMVACVSVVSPYQRSAVERIDERRLALLQTAAALSEELGYRPEALASQDRANVQAGPPGG